MTKLLLQRSAISAKVSTSPDSHHAQVANKEKDDGRKLGL